MDGEFMAAPRMRTCSNPQSRLMPIIRYVLFASAFVVALLFALDRSLPPLDAVSASSGVDRTVIRIHSARSLPEKIILDTSTGIAAAPSMPLLAAEAPSQARSQVSAAPEAPQHETEIAPAPRLAAKRTAAVRSKRAAISAFTRRLYDRQVMVGAF